MDALINLDAIFPSDFQDIIAVPAAMPTLPLPSTAAQMSIASVLALPKKSDTILSRKVEDVVASYKMALLAAGSDAYSQLSAHFRNVESTPLTLTTLMPIVESMLREFQQFALMQRSDVCFRLAPWGKI
jgi:hypothetical protein